MMNASTTKQLMDQSKLFRGLFWGAIICLCVGAILCIIFPFTSCATTNNRQSCYYYFTYYTYDCTSNGIAYCCGSGYQYCGNYSYCIIKPYYYTVCYGLLIAGTSLLGVACILAIFVFVMFCNFRSKIRNGAYINAAHQPYNQPNLGNPMVIYANQPISAQQYQGNFNNGINLSQSQ